MQLALCPSDAARAKCLWHNVPFCGATLADCLHTMIELTKQQKRIARAAIRRSIKDDPSLDLLTDAVMEAMRDNPPPSPQGGAQQQGQGKGQQRASQVEQQETRGPGPQAPPQHPQFEEIWRRIRAGFRTLLLVGPSGSGKTTLFYQVAAQLAAEEGHKVEPRLLSFTSGLTRSEEHTSELQSQSNIVCRL